MVPDTAPYAAATIVNANRHQSAEGIYVAWQ
jgi:hypothetical protein